jgi:hypothetical protein
MDGVNLVIMHGFDQEEKLDEPHVFIKIADFTGLLLGHGING